MKKLIYLLSITTILIFTFAFNVNAATYQANELESGSYSYIRVNQGDVLDFGSGSGCDSQNKSYSYNKIGIYRTADVGGVSRIATLQPGESYVFDIDCLVQNNGIGNDTELFILTSYTEAYFTYNGQPYGRYGEQIDLKSGETKRIPLHIDSVVPTEIVIMGTKLGATGFDWRDTDVEISHNVDYVDIEYGKWCFIRAFVNYGDYGGPNFPLSNAYCATAFFNINNIESDENDNNANKENDESYSPSITPQTPSTVQNGTVQVALDNKGYANIKALNPYLHDSFNQKLIADIYAAKLKKRANVLIQKNLIPPYGVKNEWKATSHTIRWKDLNVKKGDSVLIVWYTPTFFGRASTLKYINATVVEDGVIEFEAPSMGDMSVMSIVKLI